MLAGRNGQVAKTHNLSVLLGEFPESLREHMRMEYSQYQKRGFDPIVVIGLIQSASEPPKPSKAKLDSEYQTFDGAIHAVSDCFIRARYFFDEIRSDDYAFVDVPIDPIESLIRSFDATYTAFLSGKFKGQRSAAKKDA